MSIAISFFHFISMPGFFGGGFFFFFGISVFGCRENGGKK